MTETGRSLAWRWVMLVLALAFAWAWPMLRPGSMSWSSWTPTLWVAGLVWLAWSTKNWLLGLLVGLTALLHLETSRTALSTPLGQQLACLVLLAAWCVQFGELVWHPHARWKSWISWTAVGCVIAWPVGWQDTIFVGLVHGLLWFNSITLVLVWWLQPSSPRPWHKLASFLSIIAVSGLATVVHWLVAHEVREPAWWLGGQSLSASWQQALEKLLPWPTWLGGIWLPTGLLLWAWWRTLRRGYRCWKQGVPPAAWVLSSATPLIVVRTLLGPENSLMLFVPTGALLLGYAAFDLVQGLFERMRLEPRTAPPHAETFNTKSRP